MGELLSIGMWVGCCPPGRWVVVHQVVGVGCCPPGLGRWVVVHRGVGGLLFIDVRVPLLLDCSELVGGSAAGEVSAKP